MGSRLLVVREAISVRGDAEVSRDQERRFVDEPRIAQLVGVEQGGSMDDRLDRRDQHERRELDIGDRELVPACGK